MPGITEADMDRINAFVKRSKFERCPEQLCPGESDDGEGNDAENGA